MGHRAHVDLDQVAVHGDNGDVLLNSRVGDAGFQQDHVRAAALDGNAGGGQLGNDIAAMLTDIELHNTFSFFQTNLSQGSDVTQILLSFAVIPSYHRLPRITVADATIYSFFRIFLYGYIVLREA